MSFKQCDNIPSDLQHLEAKIRAVATVLAQNFVHTKSYSVDNFDALVQRAISSEFRTTRNALVRIGVIEEVSYTVCEECRLSASDCFCVDGSRLVSTTRIIVIGDLSILLNQLVNATPVAIPYFISFYFDEGIEAAKTIHEALGKNGFMCAASIKTNEEWRTKIAGGLRAAKTLIIVETPTYYQRPFCHVEMAIGIAAGMRVVLVGMADRPLNGMPFFIPEIQKGDHRDARGELDLVKLLSESIPNPVSRHLRQEAGRLIVDMCDATYLHRIAGTLQISDVMPASSAPVGDLRNSFVQKVYGSSSPIKPDTFINNLDLGQILS